MSEDVNDRMSEKERDGFGDGGLTEVQRHADKDDQAEPGVEEGDEVDDGNDDVGDGREDAEHDVAAGRGTKEKGIVWSNSPVGKQLTLFWGKIWNQFSLIVCSEIFIVLPQNFQESFAAIQYI